MAKKKKVAIGFIGFVIIGVSVFFGIDFAKSFFSSDMVKDAWFLVRKKVSKQVITNGSLPAVIPSEDGDIA